MGVLAGILFLWGVFDVVAFYILPMLQMYSFPPILRYMSVTIGVGRILAGIFPNQRGAWFGGMATMVIDCYGFCSAIMREDPLFNDLFVGMKIERLLAFFGVVLLIMAINMPAVGEERKVGKGTLGGLLVFWGLGLDITALFIFPLLGECRPFNQLVKFTACPERETSFNTELFVLFGIFRFLAAAFPNEKGAWFGGMAAMLLHGMFMADFGSKRIVDGAAVIGLCGVTFLVMARTIPGAGQQKQN